MVSLKKLHYNRTRPAAYGGSVMNVVRGLLIVLAVFVAVDCCGAGRWPAVALAGQRPAPR